MLEIGGGLGVLSEHLAARAAHVHVVEVDRRLEPALRERLAPFAERHAALRRRDARSTSPALEPAPDKVVANLPYGIAATADPAHDRGAAERRRSWVVMVQREVGERLAAAPGSGGLRRPVGARAARLRGAGAAPVARTRVPPGAERRLRAASACDGAGRRPRPTCARSSTTRSRIAARRSPGRSRWRRGVRRRPRAGPRRARGARPPRRRARRAPRAAGVPRAGGEAGAHEAARARAGQGQPVPVARRDPGRRPPRARDGVRVGVARRRADAHRARAAGGDEVVCAGVEGPNLAAAALAACDRAAGRGRRCGSRSTSTSRSPRAWAAARPTPPPRCASRPRLAPLPAGMVVSELAAALGADVPSQLAPGAPARHRRRRGRRAGRADRCRTALVIVPLRRGSATAGRLRRGRPARTGPVRRRS